jgi:hypothetical protein
MGLRSIDPSLSGHRSWMHWSGRTSVSQFITELRATSETREQPQLFSEEGPCCLPVASVAHQRAARPGRTVQRRKEIR